MVRGIFKASIWLLVALPVLAQFPSVTNRVYWPGMWREEQPWGQYQLGYWHEDSFNITWSVGADPAIGYLYHSANTVGVNDTVKVKVIFDNRSSEDVSLAGLSPEDWFYPVLYDPYVDIFKAAPVADTSDFEYRFEHWVTRGGLLTPRPDTLFSLPTRGWNKAYGLVYSVWDVNPGIFRIILKPTSFLPAYVKIVVDTPDNFFEMRSGECALDTLNSYAAVALNALSRREYTLFNNYVSNIFARDPQSLVGWALRYHGFGAQLDTTDAIAAVDSVLNIITNRLDPLIPDTSAQTPVHTAWLEQWKVDYQHYRARMLYPEMWFLPPM